MIFNYSTTFETMAISVLQFALNSHPVLICQLADEKWWVKTGVVSLREGLPKLHFHVKMGSKFIENLILVNPFLDFPFLLRMSLLPGANNLRFWEIPRHGRTD